MREGCQAAAPIALAVIVAAASLLPTFAGFRTPPIRAQWFPEINHAAILIDGDVNFTQENGVRGGSGTANDPFWISDWGIRTSYNPPALEVRNTRAFFVVHNISAGEGGVLGVVVLTNVSNARIEASSVYGTGKLMSIIASQDVIVTGSELGRWTDWGPGEGPAIVRSDRITLTNNTILSRLDLDSSTNVTLQGNAFVYGGITWHGSSPTHFTSHVIGPDNLAQGKPIRYYARCADQVIDGSGAGQVLVADCDRVHVANLTLDDPQGYINAAIQLAYVRGANISSNRVRYVHWAIALDHVTDAVVFGNRVRETRVGISLHESTGVVVFHNDLIDGDPTIDIMAQDDRGAENNWSTPYPTGGNYWSLYNAPDRCSGPNQDNCTGPDGIVDQGVVIDGNSTDRYPVTLPVAFVDAPPVIMLTVQPPPTRAQELVWIDTAGSNDPDGSFWPVRWDVDGPVYVSPGPGTLTYFIFESVRTYHVTLTVQDDLGVRANATVTIDILSPHSTPNVQFTMIVGAKAVTQAFAGDTVTLDGSASSDPYGPLTSYVWYFSEGGQAEGRIVSHTYPNPGQFQVSLTVVNDRGDAAVATANLMVFAPPVFEDYANSAGFHLPIPVNWTRQENVDVGGFARQLVLTGPSANSHSTRIVVDTDRDSTVRETPAYLDDFVQSVLSDVQKDRPDAYLDGSPLHRTISGHASVTFVIRYPSDGLVQEATVVVSEAHERFWFLLLTVDSSLFILGDRVIDTMSTGLVITLAPIPPNVGGVPLSSLGIVLAIVLGVFGGALGLRALSLRSRRGVEDDRTSASGPEIVATPQENQETVCRFCSQPTPPEASYCPSCGSQLK